VYVPRIFGFKIFKQKGSKYYENKKNNLEVTYFGEDKQIAERAEEEEEAARN